MKRRGFLLAGVAALACLAGQAKATVPLTFVDNGVGIPGGPTITGLGQAQSNSLTISGVSSKFGAAPAPGDLALYYGCVNTSATASGIQAIAAGPTGWTALSGAGVAQVSTTPTFTTRGIWWKVLTAADIATDTVSYSTGTLATFSACGMMIFRGGGNTFTLRSSGGVGTTNNVNFAFPAKPVGLSVMIELFCLRADLAETLSALGSPFTAALNFHNSYPGVMFAGAFYYSDPTSYTAAASQTGSWGWTTASSGFHHEISIP